MSKIIDSLVQGSIDGKNYAGITLVKLHFSPIRRYCGAYQSIYWDEGEGEVEYEGTGGLSSIGVLNESSELSAQTLQLTLSGIDNATITDIFSEEYIGKPAYIWYGTLNKNTYAVEGGQDGPILIFAGRMDYGTIEFGETATITLNVTSRLADWERIRGGRFNHAYQQRHVDPTDLGFRYVQALQNIELTWGKESGASSGGGGPGPGDPPYHVL